MSRHAALALFLVSAGCARSWEASEEGRTLPPGQWGGDQIGLEISATGRGHVSLSCGSADFTGPVKLDVGGHFLTAGTYTRKTGVETVDGPVPVPANISGRLEPGGVLWLDVAIARAYPVRSARLRRGAAAKLVGCL
jgi:hypothetical protein